MTINNAETPGKNLNFPAKIYLENRESDSLILQFLNFHTKKERKGLRDLLADTNNRFMVIFAYCRSQLFCLVLFFIARKMIMQGRSSFYAAALSLSMSRKF